MISPRDVLPARLLEQPVGDRQEGGLNHYVLGLERETRFEPSTLCLGSSYS